MTTATEETVEKKIPAEEPEPKEAEDKDDDEEEDGDAAPRKR
jgi:hypothetical protein